MTFDIDYVQQLTLAHVNAPTLPGRNYDFVGSAHYSVSYCAFSVYAALLMRL